jgi:Holliday junction resolvasome RuvABC endonuclease subunit
MKIFAVDPGTKNIGIATDAKYHTIVKNQLGKSGLFDIAEELIREIRLYNPDLISIEDYSRGGMFNIEEAEIVGIILYLLQGFNCDIMFMPIGTHKKVTTGSGRASKTDIKKAVKEIYNIKTSVTHEADALSILYTTKKFVLGELDAKTTSMLESKKFRL